MEKLQAFNILGIEETKDERVIKSAYRMALSLNNPEENPEGFKLLREAYEFATEYARAEDEEATVSEDGTFIGSFKIKLNELYMDFENRMDISKWKELLSHDVFDDLEYSEEAKWVLFSYLSQYYRIPFSIYRLLDEKFDIVLNEKEFKEKIAEGFIDYIIRAIKDTEDIEEFPYKWIKGPKNADYDKYINDLIHFYNAVDVNNYEDTKELDRLVALLDTSGIWHPYHEIYKAKYYAYLGRVEEAVETAKGFLEKPECAESPRSHTLALEILFYYDDKEFAKDELLKISKEIQGLFIAEKCLMEYCDEKSDYFEALEHYNNAMNYYRNEDISQKGAEISEKFVNQCREKIKTEVLEEKIAKQFAYSLLHIDEKQECIDFLASNKEKYEKLDDYHKLLAASYAGMLDYDNTVLEADKYIEIQNQIIAENEKEKNEANSEKKNALNEEEKGEEADREDKILTAKYDKAWAIALKAKMYHAKYRRNINDGSTDSRNERWDARKKAYELFLEADSVIEDNINIKRSIISFGTDVNKQQLSYDYCEKYLEKYPEDYSAMYEMQRTCVELGKGQEVIDLYFRLNEIYDKDPYVYTRAIVVFLKYNQLNDAKDILNKARNLGLECFLLDVLEAEIVYEDIINQKEFHIDELKAIFEKFDDLVKETEAKIEVAKVEKNRDELDNLLKEKIYAMAEVFYMKANIMIEEKASYEEIREEIKKAIFINDRRKYHELLVSLADRNDDDRFAYDELNFIGVEYGFDESIYGRMAYAAAVLPLDDGGDKVFEYIDKAIEMGADSAYANRKFAETYYRYAWDKKNYNYLDMANKHWIKMYEMSPEDTAEATYYIASNLNMMADYGNAVKYAIMSDNAEETDSAKKMLANAYRGCGNLVQAIAIYNQLFARTENEKTKYRYKRFIAEIYSAMGDFDNALNYYDEYLCNVEDKTTKVDLLNLCFLYGKYDLARNIAARHFDKKSSYMDIYIGYSYFYEARDEKKIKNAEKFARKVIKKCSKITDENERITTKAMAENLLSDIFIFKRGEVAEGMKLKYAAQRVLKKKIKFGGYENNNIKILDEMMFLAYESCDIYRKDRIGEKYKNMITRYSRNEYLNKRSIEAYTENADPEDNTTFIDTCYVIKYLCYEGRFDKAYKLIKDKLSNTEKLNFISRAEAESMRLETMGLFYETYGDMNKAMRYYLEENQRYGYSKMAMLKVYNIAANKFDYYRENGVTCFAYSKIKMTRAKLNIDGENNYIELVYTRKNFIDEVKHYNVYHKYHTSQLIIPLSNGELLKYISGEYPLNGTYMIVDETKLKYIKNILTEQAILEEEIKTIYAFNKYIRKEIAKLMRENIIAGIEDMELPIFEAYYQGKNCFERYGVKYKLIEGSRMHEVIEKVAYDIVDIYDANLQKNLQAIQTFEDYE